MTIGRISGEGERTVEIIHAAGLSIFMNTQTVRRGLEWSSVIGPGFWFGTMLKGRVAIDRAARGESVWRAGTFSRFHSERPVESRHMALEDGEVSGVFVRIAPEHAESIVGAEGLGAFASPGRETGEAPADATAGGDRKTAVLVQALAWQMFGCPLRGASRRCYLAGKALEIVAHMVGSREEEPAAAPVTGSGRNSPARSWTPQDIERLHHARDLLLARLESPPTVPDLALAVGINTRKLGQGFVELFGEPVYGFVKSRRLEGARLMLEAGETSVARVAYAFGYQPAHFATEFRKRFGVSPAILTGRRASVTGPEMGAPNPE
ncbi:helix-turn-helix transcriptional regulator [Azospirillum sp. RWY-5-1]|uniref:Helix-turn-helix transcriptional regulator n=1 Tax=Azospirillum oleiclasticum TaxID=2735135 RepID=A0ABX2TM54_9PROT|nr:AraC family transcriptional regulator [Azospirillum oleiclasticum]NYZ14604.1 helix-turn-helix transcriptional regulator [Azospirillum oleiclasticum]NYZ24382.1 helix-turn-helix transcriptional regulator [Azospirillum oleiclasticum]